MPTPKELRLQAKECLELADKANEYYVRTALKELAQKLQREARRAEGRMATFSRLQTHPR
jgi:hypothetical protein